VRIPRCVKLPAVLCGVAIWLLAQGLTTRPSRDDWEEINFAFSSSILTDGFPSLLGLADLLNQNPGYNARLYGYTDSVGSDSFNDRLSKARAEAVKSFLVKHGARPAQVETIGRGKLDPQASNDTREGRFINRSVRVVVADERGKPIGAGSLGGRLRPIRDNRPLQPPAPRARPVSSTSGSDPRYCFAVQVGAFRERANAERQTKLMHRESRTAQVQLWEADPPLWRVLVGCEPTREAARPLVEQLAPQLRGAFIVRVDAPPAGS